MKINSNNGDAANLDVQNTGASTQTPPSDLLFQLMMQLIPSASVEQNLPVEDTNQTIIQNDANPLIAKDNGPDASVLEQLQLMEGLKTKSDNSEKNKALKNDALENKNIDIENLPRESESKMVQAYRLINTKTDSSTLLDQANFIDQNKIDDFDKLIKSDVASIIQKQETDPSTFLQDLHSKSLDAQKNLNIKSIENDINLIPNPLTMSNNYKANLNNAVKTDSISVSTVNEIKDISQGLNDEVKKSVPSEQNNLTNQIFSQLGHFITKQANDIPPTNSSVASAHPFSEKIIPEDAVSFELLPRNIEAINQQVYDAKIKIYPPELGPITAKLKVEKNSADLIIITNNDRVKEIVEYGLPQLREQFQRSDITINNIQVNTVQSQNSASSSHPDQSSQQSPQHETARSKEYLQEFSNKQTSSLPKSDQSKPNSLIDTYA